MGTKNNNKLFFTCSLIEYIGRLKKKTRREITELLGKENIDRIYEYADVLHCEPIEKVAHEFVTECMITTGNYDNVIECRYRIPDYWDIGEVYERLIEDSYKNLCYNLIFSRLSMNDRLPITLLKFQNLYSYPLSNVHKLHQYPNNQEFYSGIQLHCHNFLL